MAHHERGDFPRDGAGMKWFRRRPDRDKDMDEELAYHRAMLTEERGSEHSASRKLGNATRIKEEARAVWMWTWFETLLLDLRFGVRQLRKKPLLITVAALSLALGIGANTAIFTVINSLLLQSLPVRDPGRLVLFYDGLATGVYSGGQPKGDMFSFPFWKAIQGKISAFEDLCAFRQSIDRVTLHFAGADDGAAREQARVHLVSGNYFQVFGVPAALGRVLQASDDALNASPVVVISHDYWRNRLNSDPHVIGKTVVLNSTAFTIVGVAAREFFGERVTWPPDYWVPLSFQSRTLMNESWIEPQDVYWLNMMGRLRAGVTRSQAEGEVNLRLHEYYLSRAGSNPSAQERRDIAAAVVHLKSGAAGISGLRFRFSSPLHVLMGAVALVLLIACANVAILFMARASARTQEFLARIALGASRSRVIRQVLAECVLLSGIAGLLGVAVAWMGVKGLVAVMGIDSPLKIKPDMLVLTFTAGVSVVTGVLFGLIPAVKCSRMEPRAGVLTRRMEFGTGRFSSTRVLIASQVALSLVLLFGSALLAHSLSALETENLGYQRTHILIVSTDPRLAGYQPNQLLALYQQFDARLNRMPGVLSASLARYTPVDGTLSRDNVSVEGRTLKAGQPASVDEVAVGPRFFETLRVPVLRGRGIADTDLPSTTPVVVVNQTFVDRFLGGLNPIGQHINLGSPFTAPGYEVIGVVADSRFYDVRENPTPMAFFSAWQGKAESPYAGDLILSVTGDPASIAPQVRKVLHSIDSRLPVTGVATLDEQIRASFHSHAVVAELSGLFALLALLLSALGIYGSCAYLVARRMPEMGIRMALGARRSDVLWMVLRDALAMAGAGIVIGIPCAMATTRLIRGFLFGVSSADPLASVAALSLIAAAVATASYLPARRATRIAPMSALRYE